MEYGFISPNTLMVECAINPSNNTTQNQNIFGVQQQLMNRKVVAIEAFNSLDLAYSGISTANPVLSPTLFNNCTVSFYTASIWDSKGALVRPEGLYYDRLPLASLRRLNNYFVNPVLPSPTNNSNSNALFRIRPSEISWDKSYVNIPNPITIGAQSYSAIFVIHYLDAYDTGEHYAMH